MLLARQIGRDRTDRTGPGPDPTRQKERERERVVLKERVGAGEVFLLGELLRLEKFQNIMGMIFAWCTLWSVGGFVRETEAFEKILRPLAAPR